VIEHDLGWEVVRNSPLDWGSGGKGHVEHDAFERNLYWFDGVLELVETTT
jgi:hypothetical protein